MLEDKGNNDAYLAREARWTGPNIGAWWEINSNRFLNKDGRLGNEEPLDIADSWCLIAQLMAIDLGYVPAPEKPKPVSWSIGRSST